MKMKSSLVFAVFAASAVLSAAVPTPKSIHGWNTWQRPNEGGKFERIKPSAELPQGAMKFLPDPGKKRYGIQWYKALPATQTDHLRFIFTFQSAPDTNADVTVILKMQAQKQTGAWYNQPLKALAPVSVTVEPGKTQEIALEVDLGKYELPEMKFLCPMIALNNLTAGSVTFTGLKVEPVDAASAQE